MPEVEAAAKPTVNINSKVKYWQVCLQFKQRSVGIGFVVAISCWRGYVSGPSNNANLGAGWGVSF